MHSPNSRHTATEGPWVPEPIVVNEVPTPIQTPKPYVLVMLKGFCTEFFDDYEQMYRFALRLAGKNQPFITFYYSPVMQQYLGTVERNAMFPL
jgi:hypothetical protein